MTKNILTIAFLVFVTYISYGQTDSQIKLLFKKFQEGYTERDTSQVDKFTSDLCSEDIQLIGTGEDEWLQGIVSAKNLFKSDWAYWLTLTIDTTNISLITSDNTAFFWFMVLLQLHFQIKTWLMIFL